MRRRCRPGSGARSGPPHPTSLFPGLQKAYHGSAQHLRGWDERRQEIAQAIDKAARMLAASAATNRLGLGDKIRLIPGLVIPAVNPTPFTARESLLWTTRTSRRIRHAARWLLTQPEQPRKLSAMYPVYSVRHVLGCTSDR